MTRPEAVDKYGKPINRGDHVAFWNPRHGGWYLGQVVRFHRDGKVRVKRLAKRQAFSLDPKLIDSTLYVFGVFGGVEGSSLPSCQAWELLP